MQPIVIVLNIEQHTHYHFAPTINTTHITTNHYYPTRGDPPDKKSLIIYERPPPKPKAPVRFDARSSALLCEGIRCPIPLYRNQRHLTLEHRLCTLLFTECLPGRKQGIHNDQVLEYLGYSYASRHLRMIKSTINRINVRTRMAFDCNVFAQSGGMVIRLR
jgi:hypothetical protein